MEHTPLALLSVQCSLLDTSLRGSSFFRFHFLAFMAIRTADLIKGMLGKSYFAVKKAKALENLPVLSDASCSDKNKLASHYTTISGDNRARSGNVEKQRRAQFSHGHGRMTGSEA